MQKHRILRAVSYLPLYLLCIALASALWKYPAILSVCFVAIAIFMVGRWHTTSDLAHFFLAFLLGPIGEFIAIHFGAWKYAQPTLLIPLWLPLAWGISGLYLKKTTEALSEHSVPMSSSTQTKGHR